MTLVRARDRSAIRFRGGSGGPAGVVADYYVDSVLGNDTNNGTNKSTPWLTISKLLGTSVPAGSTVGFKRGSIWREALAPTWFGTAAAPINFVAYGNGSAPRFLGSTNVSGAWAVVAGTEYNIATALVLASPSPLYYVDTATGVVTMLQRGTAGALALNECAIAAGFLHINVGFDPSAVGSVEVGQRSACILLDGTPYFNLSGLECRYSSADGMSTRNAADNVTATSCTFQYNCNDGWNVFTKSLNQVADNCVFQYNGDHLTGAYNGDGFSAHVDSTGILQNSYFGYNGKNGISNSEQGTWIIRNVTTQANSGGCIAIYGDTAGAAVAGQADIYKWASYDGGDVRTGVGIYRFLTEPANGSIINVTNCTIFKGVSSVNVPRGVRVAGASGTVTMRNVCISGTFTIGVLKAVTSTFDHDYLDVNGSTTAYSGTVAGSHSILTAPTFVDSAAHNFTPAVGSVLIAAGVAVAGVTDGYTGAAPNIGVVVSQP